MDAPKCRVCGVRHWGGGHVWPKEGVISNAGAVVAVAPPEVDPPREDVAAPVLAPDRSSEDKAAHRRAYLRDYMRKRRGGGANNISGDLENKSVK